MAMDTKKYKIFTCYNMKTKEIPLVEIKVPIEYLDGHGDLSIKGQVILQNKGYMYLPDFLI